jgi:L-ascorbate metabolism protein UlaG (beta-lactamase superfamily)
MLSDPVMSQLDFGVPLLYRGNKRFLKSQFRELEQVSNECDATLISQGIDDHAHRPTIKTLVSLRPDMNYICPPSAVSILRSCGVSLRRINILEHGQTYELKKNDTTIDIVATQGALLGPPWQTKENGWILRPGRNNKNAFPSVYYEAHCMYNDAELINYHGTDIVITPIVKQLLPGYTLVDGMEKALNLAKLLGAKTLIPLMNGDLEQDGLLSQIIQTEGSIDEFKLLVAREMSKPLKILELVPGVSAEI